MFQLRVLSGNKGSLWKKVSGGGFDPWQHNARFVSEEGPRSLTRTYFNTCVRSTQIPLVVSVATAKARSMAIAS